MGNYTVTATLEVEITNPSSLAAIASLGGGTGDELAQIRAVLGLGLKDLPSVAGRYGFRITRSEATVVPAD